MRTRKAIATLVSVFMFVGLSTANADDATDRAAQVASINTNYISTLDSQHATLLALKAKMKVDPGLLKQVNSVLADFDSNYATIKNGLNNPSQDIQAVLDLCKEEVDEFANSIYQLQQMASKIKAITCIKGKTKKTVTGLAPKCPAGYKKK